MRVPSQFRAFRLPKPLDVSIAMKAKETQTDMTAVVVQILLEAVKRGDLPKPRTQRDQRQLEFI